MVINIQNKRISNKIECPLYNQKVKNGINLVLQALRIVVLKNIQSSFYIINILSLGNISCRVIMVGFRNTYVCIGHGLVAKSVTHPGASDTRLECATATLISDLDLPLRHIMSLYKHSSSFTVPNEPVW